VSARLNHIAIVSENYAQLSKFYEAMFGMTPSTKSRPGRAVTVRDGYVGLNINPRRAGRPAGFDHFGIEVDEVEPVFDRLRTHYPMVKWLKRPSNRPFAGITTHDPDGNVFDLSQAEMTNRRDVYVENDGRRNTRYIDHFAMRTMRPAEMAEFYARIFDLKLANRKEGDAHYCLSDGNVSLVIMPWNISDYDGTGIILSGMDHIGFRVEDVETCKADIARVAGENPRLAPEPVETGPEGQALAKLFRRSCPFGEYHLADSDGVLIDVHAG
jgi:catechol 2,3-dioxygenase-like lactoylglutathione lyase family enzyme